MDSLGLLELLYGVGAVERLLRSLAAFEGLGGLEFRVSAEVSRGFWQQLYRCQLTESRCSVSGSAAV